MKNLRKKTKNKHSFLILGLLGITISIFCSETKSYAFEGQTTVVVKKGDTLQKISNELFGTTKKWYKIFSLNNKTLKSPNVIEVGQVLMVPSFEKTAVSLPEVKSDPVQVSSTLKTDQDVSKKRVIQRPAKKETYSAVENDDVENTVNYDTAVHSNSIKRKIATIPFVKEDSDPPKNSAVSAKELQKEDEEPSGPVNRQEISKFVSFAM